MLLYYLSYVAVLAAFAFVILSLASGLLYVSELIEERSSIAKGIGQRGIHVIIALHGVLYFTESLPFRHILFSAFCHVVYLQNFSYTWPVISLSSLSFISSCVLVIADHFFWFFYFAQVTQDARHVPARPYGAYTPTKHVHSFAEIATFFGICVWLAPLFLFLSLSANDNALPTTAAPQGENDPPSVAALPDSRSRSSLFKLMFGNIAAYLPGVDRSPRNSKGIIAPHSSFPQSPKHFPFDNMSPHLTSTRRSSSIPPPPRSPAIPSIAEDTGGRLSPGFKMASPSQNLQQPGRRVTVDGLGLRRKTSSSLRGDG